MWSHSLMFCVACVTSTTVRPPSASSRIVSISLRSRPGIEPAGRLVEEQQQRIGEQLARDRHALALAAAELIDALVGVRGHVDRREHLVDPRVDLRGARYPPAAAAAPRSAARARR